MLDNEYLLDMRIKNNVLYQRIMSECNSISEFAKKYNVRSDTLCKLLNFKQPIYDTRRGLNGKIVPVVSDLLKKLECELYDIIPENYEVKESNHFFKEIDAITMSQLSYTEEQSLLTDYTTEDLCVQNELKRNLNEILQTLNPREERAVRDYYYMGKTYDEIGSELGITRARAQQIVEKGLYKLRHPTRNYKLKVYLSNAEKAQKQANLKIGEYYNKTHPNYEYYTDYLTGRRISVNVIETLFKKYYSTNISFDLFYKLVTKVKVAKRKFAIYCIYNKIYGIHNTDKYNKLKKAIQEGKIQFKD